MGKMITALLLMVVLFVPGVFGGVVTVWGERFDLNIINNFYNTQGHTSSILVGTLDTHDLSGVNLLWAVQPGDAYTAAELNTMQTFLADGGRIAFMGEHGTFAPSENDRINAALSFLGADLSITNLLLDPGFRNATKLNGQIKDFFLTEGVNTYNYAAFAPLNVGPGAHVLMTGQDDPNSVMMAYQNVGGGSIFLITDQNVWDNVNDPANDNDRMFLNLLEASVVPEPPPVNGEIPEPGTWILLSGGLIGVWLVRRRLQA
jgi:hypothetical protein